MKNDKIYQKITDKIIEGLDKGFVPWLTPWIEQRNFVTKNSYRGINILMCNVEEKGCHEWLTFNQCSKLGNKVKKGVKAIPIIYVKRFLKKIVDEEGNEVIDLTTGLPKVKSFGVMRYFNVFNIEDTDIKKPDYRKEKRDIIKCETVVKNGLKKLNIEVEKSHICAYNPDRDIMKMVDKKEFVNSEEYYSTNFHEMIHATGKRLNRDLGGYFGSEKYSKEELVAEIGASYLCGVCGITNVTIENSVAYIKGWKNALKKDNKLITQAASAAQKAVDYLLDTKKKVFKIKEEKSEKQILVCAKEQA